MTLDGFCVHLAGYLTQCTIVFKVQIAVTHVKVVHSYTEHQCDVYPSCNKWKVCTYDINGTVVPMGD